MISPVRGALCSSQTVIAVENSCWADAGSQRPPRLNSGFCASSSAIGGHGWAGLGGLAEVDFLVLPEIVHVEVAVGLSQFSWVSMSMIIETGPRFCIE